MVEFVAWLFQVISVAYEGFSMNESESEREKTTFDSLMMKISTSTNIAKETEFV